MQPPSQVGWITAWGGQFSTEPATTNAHGRYGYVTIKASLSANFGIKSDGSLDVWPNTSTFPTNVPPTATNLVAVAAGASHVIALRADGTVVSWGANDYGQADVPPNATNIVAIDAGRYNSMALRADGSVFLWGANVSDVLTIPEGATNIVAISFGSLHAGALRADAALFLWGFNDDRQCNIPSGLGPIVAVDCGVRHTLVLQANGTPVAFGDNSYYEIRIPADWTNIVAIDTGTYHNVALRSDGTAAAAGLGWGAARYPSGLNGAFAISAGGDHSMALHTLVGEPLTASGIPAVQSGFVVNAGVSDTGSGYQTVPTVSVEGGGGTGAQLTANISDGRVVGFNVVSPGSGYTSTPTIRIAPPEGYQLKLDWVVSGLTLNLTVSDGAKYRLERSTDGQQWISNNTFVATSPFMTQDFVVSAPSNYFRLQQVGAAGTAVRANGFITGIVVTEAGGGYLTGPTPAPTVTISGGNGVGATATANTSNGAVTGFTITNPGSGYTAQPTVTVEPPPPAPGRVVALPNRITLTQYVQPTFAYELDASSDLNFGWAALEAASVANTNRIVREFSITNGIRFFRVQQAP